MRFVLVPLLLGSLVVLGCASAEHAYPGPERDQSEIARIDVDDGIFVEVDGERVFARDVYVLPGNREVVAEFRIEGHDIGKHVVDEYIGKLTCTLRFRAAAGFDYLVDLNPLTGGDRRGSRVRFYHSAHVRRLPNTLPDAEAPCRWK